MYIRYISCVYYLNCSQVTLNVKTFSQKSNWQCLYDSCALWVQTLKFVAIIKALFKCKITITDGLVRIFKIMNYGMRIHVLYDLHWKNKTLSNSVQRVNCTQTKCFLWHINLPPLCQQAVNWITQPVHKPPPTVGRIHLK